MHSANATMTIDGDFRGRIVLTCEHAGSELPTPWTWPDEDLWLVPTHWACDIGAGAFTRRPTILHADEFGRHALEIEARQDLILDEAFAIRLAGALQGFFS